MSRLGPYERGTCRRCGELCMFRHTDGGERPHRCPHGAYCQGPDAPIACRECGGVEVLAPPHSEARPAGWHSGQLYCYGGCGRRYGSMPDISLPTALWNRIAVGPPFDETKEGTEREGRGGVLCPVCVIERLSALNDCIVLKADMESRQG